MIDVTKPKAAQPAAEKPARSEQADLQPTKPRPTGYGDAIASATGNQWDRAFRYGEEVPSTLNPSPPPPAEVGHVGDRQDPTPREHYTVAGQIKAMNEAADAAQKEG